MKNIIYDIYDANFFITTIKLFQRGNIDTLNNLLMNGFLKEKSKEEIEKLLDYEELEIFLKDYKESDTIDTILEDFKESYLLEPIRFKNYYSSVYPDLKSFEKEIDDLFKNSSFPTNRNELGNFILDIIEPIRLKINDKNSGRNRFSLDKTSVEYLSRSNAIYNTLKKLEINLTDDYNYKLFLKQCGLELYNYYINNNNNMNESKKDLIFVIEEMAEVLQKNSQTFQVLKTNEKINDTFLIYTKDELKNIPILQAKGINGGSDYVFRIKNLMNYVFNEDNSLSRKKTSKTITPRQRKKLKDITKEEKFKKDLRRLLISILDIHKISYNANSKSLFFPYNKINNFKFLLDKNVIESPINITLNTEKDNNFTIYKLLLNIENLDEHNIIGYLNDKPLKELKIYNKLILKDINSGEKEQLLKRINKINDIKIKLEKFKENYGTMIGSYIENEFIKLYNYNELILKNYDNPSKEIFNINNLNYEYQNINDILNQEQNKINHPYLECDNIV